MSLESLSRYDDAEDEIKDEDHDLVLQTKKSLEAIRPPSRPVSDAESIGEQSNKPKSLVSYFGDAYGSSSESENDDSDVNTRTTVVNLGLHDGQASSLESGSPATIDLDTEGGIRDNLDDVRLPPQPEGRCSKSLQEKILKMYERKMAGMDVNEYVQKKKNFRNPSIYQKLVSYIGIDEHGTNFPKHIYDPSIWGPESYYEELAKAQKEYNDKKEKEKNKANNRAKVEFVSGTKKPPSTAPLATTAGSAVPEKKSKWDQGPGKK